MGITACGVNVFYKDTGVGPPALFLHGNPDTADLWDPLIGRVRHAARCLAPDLPGFGRSAAPPSFDCSLDSMAEFVDAFIVQAGVSQPLHLVVHDFGGPYGLAFAVKYPEKIKSLCVINTIFQADYRWHFWARVWRTPVLGELSMKLLNRRLFVAELKRGSCRLDKNTMRAMYEVITPATRQMILKLYRATDPENCKGWEEKLVSLAQERPSLVLWGANDPYLPKSLAGRFGAGKVVFVPGCGHWTPREAPELVSRHLLELWRRASSI
ncbi:MAG: alpha/beta hydrolase [Desulfatibacillaceae bacterium]|nr:alpha/beta hydrolase [Desulfatibacillaceae bacterium]